MNSIKDVVANSVTALQAASDIVKSSAATQEPTGDLHAAVKSLADKLKGDAAKVGVMAGDDPSSLDTSELQGLLDTMCKTVVALCTQLHTCTYQAGPSLKDSLKDGVTSLVTACEGLAKSLDSDQPMPQKAAIIKTAVGQVWDGCEAVKKLPLDNKTALFKKFAVAMKAGKDALREMDELCKEQGVQADGESGRGADTGATAPQQETNGHHTTASDEIDEDEEGEAKFEGDDLTEAEKKVLVAGRQLMDLAVQTVQLLARTILTTASLPAGCVESWESCVWHVKTLQRGVEDLGASMYGPQDPTEVAGAAEAVDISCECMLDELPEEGPVPDANQVADLQRRIETARSKLNSAVAALEADDS